MTSEDLSEVRTTYVVKADCADFRRCDSMVWFYGREKVEGGLE